MTLSPIILFVYNRPWHTEQTIEALKKNELAKESELFIFSDGPKNEKAVENVNEVRNYIKKISGFKNITLIEREKNWGLAANIIDGVTYIITKYEKVIVLEDDLVTSPYFLKYMNDALDTYTSRKDVFSITGFSFSSKFMKFPKTYVDDIYLNIRPMSWSWATWLDRWENVDWDIKDYDLFVNRKDKIREFCRGGTDLPRMLKLQMGGKIDSWYIRWTYNAILNKKYTIYPKISHVNNMGHDNSGIHCGSDKNNLYSHNELNYNPNIELNYNIWLNHKIISRFNAAFNTKFLPWVVNMIKDTIEAIK